MRAKPVLAGLFVVTTLLTLGGGITLAQTLPFDGKIAMEPEEAAVSNVAGSIPVQGFLTDANGRPLEGEYAVTMSLYDSALSTNPLCQDSKTVQVSKGRFNASLGSCLQSVLDGRQLYFGIKVGSDQEMTPRQPVYPVPYAISLQPGAVISNMSTGHALEARSSAADPMSAAIWAENTHSNGIAFWAQNNSLASTAQMQNLGSGPALQAQNSGTSSTVSVKNLSSGTALQVENSGSASTAEITNLGTGAAFSVENNGTSATLSVKNQGSGPLIQAYNGAETPDQFRVGNDGSIASQADTYVFIPGSAFVKQESIDSTTWKMMGDGSAQIASGSSYLIPKVINYPITLPSMLYGHPVEVKSLTIYYKCLDGAKGWISETQLQLGPMIDSVLIMGQDFNDHKSTSWTSYTIPISINNLLTNDQGILGLHLHLSFVDATSYVQIGGIRLQLGTYRSE